MHRTCKKKRFKDKIGADIALSSIDMRVRCKGQSDKAPIRSYHCNKCKYWHVTSEPLMQEENETL